MAGARRAAKRGSAKKGTFDDVRAQRKRLATALPQPRCELEHGTAWQLLVATILSAQSTDGRVNQVTPGLFRRWPTPSALGSAPQEEVVGAVKITGFFRNNARSIREA